VKLAFVFLSFIFFSLQRIFNQQAVGVFRIPVNSCAPGMSAHGYSCSLLFSWCVEEHDKFPLGIIGFIRFMVVLMMAIGFTRK
jgi:hypothetical protein